MCYVISTIRMGIQLMRDVRDKKSRPDIAVDVICMPSIRLENGLFRALTRVTFVVLH